MFYCSVSLMDEMNQNKLGRFRMSLRETLVAVVVGALAIGVFLGVIRIMAPGSGSPEPSAPPAAAAPAAAADPADYEETESPS